MPTNGRTDGHDPPSHSFTWITVCKGHTHTTQVNGEEQMCAPYVGPASCKLWNTSFLMYPSPSVLSDMFTCCVNLEANNPVCLKDSFQYWIPTLFRGWCFSSLCFMHHVCRPNEQNSNYPTVWTWNAQLMQQSCPRTRLWISSGSRCPLIQLGAEVLHWYMVYSTIYMLHLFICSRDWITTLSQMLLF
jgi:hypothetical protein